MNKLTKEEYKVWTQYSKMRGSYIHRCKVDCLNVHFNGEYEHELAKFNLFWKLRKEGSRVLTEAWDKDGNRRDLIDLTNGEIYEIETTPERAARFIGQPINIIPVGWEFTDKKWLKLKGAMKDDMVSS